MKQLLADTQLLVWLAEDSEQMPRQALKELMSAENRIVFSLVSIWETSIKFALGRASFTVDPEKLRRGLLGFGFVELPITSEQVIAVSSLPHIHRDPFDRLLVAQAKLEGLTLMTADKTLAKYGDWVKRY